MSNPDNPFESNYYKDVRKRLLASVRTRMEGKINRDSAEDVQMFDELFDELLQEEHMVLTRAERKRLYDDLFTSF